MNWAAQLDAQLDWYWLNVFWPRLAGLSDDEYLWEPVAGCWGVRPAGDGRFVDDFQWPEPSPPTVTAIAWRLCHIVVPGLARRNSTRFGVPGFDIQTFDWPGTAALALLDREYDRWKSGVEAMDRAVLRRKAGPAEGPFAECPMAALILHINRELIHHAAEAALLRDLYRAGL